MNGFSAREDAAWMVQQFVDMTPVDPVEELRKANQELLRALLELAAFQVKDNAKAGAPAAPSAA